MRSAAEESTFEDVFLESTEEQGKQQVRLVLSASHLTLIPVAGAQQQDEPQRHPLCDFLHPTPGGGSGEQRSPREAETAARRPERVGARVDIAHGCGARAR